MQSHESKFLFKTAVNILLHLSMISHSVKSYLRTGRNTQNIYATRTFVVTLVAS